ncbi:MAG: hypothetical protein ACTSRG_11475 [Candidatus Helarchaeota archaeon]
MNDEMGIFDVNNWNYLNTKKISLNILLPIILNFGKNRNWTSFPYFRKMTGLSDQTINQRLRRMRNLNLIIRTKKNGIFCYAPTHELTEEIGNVSTLSVPDFFNKLLKFLKSNSFKG